MPDRSSAKLRPHRRHRSVLVLAVACFALLVVSLPGVASATSHDLPPGWGPPPEEEPSPPEPPPGDGGSEPGWITPLPDPGGSSGDEPDWFSGLPSQPAPAPAPDPEPEPAPNVVLNPVRTFDPPANTTITPVTTIVVVDDGPSSMSVSLAASPTSMLQTGGLVRYDITIVNTSAADAVTIESVTDDMFGDVSGSCLPAIPATIPPNSSILCSFRERVSSASSTQLVNLISVTGVDDDGERVLGRGTVTVDVLAAADLEVTVYAESANVPVGENATWQVVVANRGPSEATGVSLRVEMPREAALVSNSCVSYLSTGRVAAECGFDPRTRLAEVARIPAGGAHAMTLVTTLDTVGSLEIGAEIVAFDQVDSDSRPADRQGDDLSSAAILMTVGQSDSPHPPAAGSPGALPLWPLALLVVVIAVALARAGGITRWRLR